MQSSSQRGQAATSHSSSSPMPPPLSPMMPIQSNNGHFTQIPPTGSLRPTATSQSSVCGQVSPVSSMATSGTFRHHIAQPMPQIFTTVSPMAVPLSPSIFQVAAGNLVSQTPIFAATQQGISQFQPVFLNGQQAAIINSVPGSPVGLVGTPATGTAVPAGIFAAAAPTTGIPGAAIPALQSPIQFMNPQQVQSLTPPRPGSGALTGQDPDLPTDLTKKSKPSTPQPVDADARGAYAVGSPSVANPEIDQGSKVKKEESIKENMRDKIVPAEEKKKEMKAGEKYSKKLKEDTGEGHRYDNIDTCDYTKDGVPVEYDEPDFVWEEYLQETGGTAVPPTAFKHVECSLESGFVKGMKLEVPNKCNTDTYWVASVIMTCGPLLRLRYDGYEEDTSADFWCDLMTSEIHPIGWCAQNNQILQPPEAIKDKFDDWREFLVRSLTGARTAPSYLLDKTTGITPIDQLKQNMRLELQHPINPMEIWLVKILENVGGRLYLRFEGADTATNDFWLFYLNHRLHPIGWAKSNGYRYNPPKELFSEHSEREWMQILEKALKEAEKMILPLAIFKNETRQWSSCVETREVQKVHFSQTYTRYQDQVDINQHRFQKGWKLEALNPILGNQICPATVVEILDSRYFVVELDDLQPHIGNRIRFSCYADSKCIFPVQWCQCKGLKLHSPKGWPKVEFSWPEYLAYHKATAAPEICFNLSKPDHEFEKGMKLEAVNPENPNQICAATITKIVDPLIWIHLDNSNKVVASHIEHVDSHNVFPVGWCESNGYQLKPPRKTSLKGRPQNKVAVVRPDMTDSLAEEAYTQLKNGDSQGNAWCPKIYYNHQCFSGPYLSKGRIALLPKCVGPGPITLVMKEVLSMLISVAYKSCRVLRELQMEGKCNPNMLQQSLKAKYKGKSYRAMVEICRNTDQLEEFCRSVCIKLECCPNLISPHFVNGSCPEKCSQLTKTKYTYYYGKKKKKLGRPPGGHTNLENGPKKPGKRGRRRKIRLLHQTEGDAGVPPGDGDGAENGDNGDDEDKDSVASDTRTIDSSGTNDSIEKKEVKTKGKHLDKRKYTHHLPPPSEIKTRGAKMPKYSFERRTHKKIMIPRGVSPSRNIRSHISKQQHEQKISAIKEEKSEEASLKLESNPLNWSVAEVVKFIKSTDCAHLARLFKEQEIDGQALLLLTLPTVQEYLELKLGPAIKLCHQIEKVKIAFYDQYAK